MNKQFVSDLKVNEKVNSCFMMTKKNLKMTKHDKPYLEITLLDKTGRIEARVWDEADVINRNAETGDIVHVKGMVDKFREEKQIKVDFLQRADENAFDYADMVRVVENRDKLFKDVTAYLKKLKNPWIKSLAEAFLSDEEFVTKFSDGIGGKSWHNAYIGGLLEHTYEVMFIADHMSALYPDADRDTLIFGAFIHDIGKVHELDEKKMEYTIEGGLIGHITIGYNLLMKKIDAIEGFPEELALRLGHIVLSHHGEYEQQSPVLPKTLEATIVYQIDELVSQANAIKELKTAQAAEGKIWSDYISIKGRKYFVKDAGGESWYGG